MDEKQLYTVLSIDGGGIRGIIPLRVIAEIEGRLGRPISDAIDLAAGSSTGGIIAAGLTAPHPVRPDQPRFKAQDLEQFYVNDGPEIFEKKRWFAGLRSLF
ncbi:MAG: patatin-like phospholipase family protein, partial [Pseudomonadota bacterium]